jgi:hypothetical protein
VTARSAGADHHAITILEGKGKLLMSSRVAARSQICTLLAQGPGSVNVSFVQEQSFQLLNMQAGSHGVPGCGKMKRQHFAGAVAGAVGVEDFHVHRNET